MKCDGCGRLHYFEGEDPAFGLYVSWSEVASSGAWGGELYACNEKCLIKAIRRRGEVD